MTTPAPPVQIAQDEILTGEAVALDVQPLGFFLRALGALIDVLCGVALLLLSYFVGGFVVGGLGLENLSGILVVSALVLVLVVIPTAIETLTRGRSLGKLAVGGRIVRTDGGATGFRQAFIRALVGVLEIWFTFGALAGIVATFTPRSTRLGDMVAGTYCERTRAPRLPTPAGPVPGQLQEWAEVADVGRLPDRIARRATQFARSAEGMEPGARSRSAAMIAAEIAPFVSPLPHSDPETLVRAVVAVRRDREYAAIMRTDERAAALVGAAQGTPRGFPVRPAGSRAG
ncbi:RDD family protein [Microbacterium sp. NE2HP2]|uniref:RDD family protein n=1 Tax=Microbacterium TaxID=33882 RepID=UPI002365ADA4|nr:MULTISPECIES: RDD family protein [Microbacterium]MDD7945073.1 RDD family protein [Microbacterium plantarum]WHE35464.1 RDD family protein [Microbacterium sp. BDGP8]WRK16626.1 RDD family protein [Microbacterium plantarum]